MSEHTTWFVKDDHWRRFIRSLAAGYTVMAPRRREGGYYLEPFDAEHEDEFVFNPYRVVEPLKMMVFPVRERVATFFGPEDAEPEQAVEKPLAIIGAKACDLRALEYLDKAFLADPVDLEYARRRSALLIISADCTDSLEECFCRTIGYDPAPTTGFDLNLSPVTGGFLVEPGSDKGRQVLADHPEWFGEIEDTGTREQQRSAMRQQVRADRFRMEGLAERLPASEGAEVWEKLAEDCVECGACTNVCPSCQCFYLFDRPEAERYARLRIWDSCQFKGYARVGGGANPRKRKADRIVHRMLHKFVHYPEYFKGPGCVGCGRCLQACLGDLDPFAKLEEI